MVYSELIEAETLAYIKQSLKARCEAFSTL